MSGAHPDGLVIAQVSDIHCGDPRLDRAVMQTCIETVNAERPGLFIVAGDLTATSYRDEYEEALGYLGLFAGNHDRRNVGYLHFEELVGLRSHSATSASWKTVRRAWEMASAPILASLSWMLRMDRADTSFGRAKRLKRLPGL